MGELGSSRESYESTANEILDKYKGRAPIFGEASSKVLVSNGVNTEQVTTTALNPSHKRACLHEKSKLGFFLFLWERFDVGF